MYHRFAQYYDALMSDYDYDDWASRVIARIREKLPHAKTGYDLACGSGNFTVRFADAGFRMTGADISAQMLAVAQQKSAGKRIGYLEQSINEANFPDLADFITIMCDGVNYCTDGIAFDKLAAALKPRGVLIFDISSAYHIQETLAGRIYYEDLEDITYYWENIYSQDSKILDMDIAFFVKQSSGLYERFNEIHRMRAYTIAELKNALKPYFRVEIFDETLENPPEKTSRRIHFVCVKKGK